MTEPKKNRPHVSLAWREWLETQTTTQLTSSLAEREKVVLNLDGADRDHMMREIEMIKDEFKRRDSAVFVRDEFFPRITMRNARDAVLLAHLLHSHAVETIEMAEKVAQIKLLHDAGYKMNVSFTDINTGKATQDFEQVQKDLAEGALHTAELLASVSEELQRLRESEGVKLSEKEAADFDAIANLVQEVKGEES